ncbi:MAG: PAS domain S-box protein [Bacteroidales bacterium]
MSPFTIRIEDLPNAAMILNSSGDIIEVNSSFADILSFQQEELVGSSVYRFLISEEDQSHFRKIISEIKIKKPGKLELVFLSKDNHSYTLDVFPSYLNLNSSAESLVLIHAVNVTHYKRVNDELKEQRRFHRTLVNNMPAVVYRCNNDSEWTMNYVSPFCEELTGYKPEDLLNNKKVSFNEIIHPDYREELWDQWQEAIKNRQVFTGEYIIITASGQHKWVWEQGVGVFDSNDELIGLEGIIFDVTKRKETEDALRISEKRFRLILENMPILLNAFDDDGNMIVWNKACEEATGYSADEIIGNPNAFKILYPDPAYRDHVWKASLDPNNKNNVYDLVTKDGSVRTISWFDTYHHVSIPGWSTWGIGLDITEQKKALEALSDSEAKFRMLVDNAFDGIYLMRNRRYEYVNQRFVEITGYNCEELTSANFDFNMLLTNKSLEMVEQRYRDREQGKRISHQYELQIKSKQGIIREVEVSTASVSKSQDVLVLGIMRDITERKRTQKLIKDNEAKLKRQNEEYFALNEELTETNNRIKQINRELRDANQRAEEHDKLKSAFLANMSHEVRTPMNGILGFSQLLLDGTIDNAEREEFVGIIQNCGNQLLAIINDLIDISKIEANQISLNPTPVNINELLNEQLLLFKPKAEANHLTLEKESTTLAPASTIMVDGTRLRQIISNLIGNAIKFTPEGRISYGCIRKHDVIEFYVKDTGVGIPASKQAYIFERFRQVETELARQTSGTGLGLAISKALVSKMGGKIWVESEPGHGSTFRFTIPSKDAVNHVVDPLVTEKRYQTLGKKPQILIADDNEINYLYLKELLKGVDADLLWVTNGQEAVSYVRNNPNIDLILMDIKMPVMDGYEATREVKKIRHDLPIIAQTAYAMTSDREKAAESGCDDYISKPINKENFISIINHFLNSE